MSAIKKIRAYIAKNPIPGPDLEGMSFTEAVELSRTPDMGRIEAPALSYEYGRARGYQIAIAERDKGGASQ